MSGPRDEFNTARKNAVGAELEELRQNYFIQAKMQGNDDESVGGLNINKSGRKNDSASGKGKSKKNSIADDLLFLDMLEQKYGEDFAENWAAELLDEDTYNDLMKIEDQDERREAIAEAIIEGIRNGTIDPSSIDDIPDLKEWLERYNERPHRTMERAVATSETKHEFTEGRSEEAAFNDLFSNETDGFTPS